MAANDFANEPKIGFFGKFLRYFRELKSETKKIVWPSRKQTIQNTLVVLTMMALVGGFIWILDLVFTRLMSLVISR